MFQISTLLSNVDSIVVDNVMYCQMNGIKYRLTFNGRIPDGIVFYDHKRYTVVMSSIVEYLNKITTPFDKNMYKPPVYNMDMLCNVQIGTLKAYMKERGIFRYDKFATLKKGWIYIFYRGGLLKVFTGIEDLNNIKILTLLLLLGDSLVSVVTCDGHTGIEMHKSQFSVVAHYPYNGEVSKYANEVIPKLDTKYFKQNFETTYNNRKFETYVGENGTIKELNQFFEFYSVPTLM